MGLVGGGVMEQMGDRWVWLGVVEHIGFLLCR